MKLNTSAHRVHNLKAQIIPAAACRRKAVTSAIPVRPEEIFSGACAHCSVSLPEFSGGEANVHLLLTEYPPVLRLSDFIRVLKSLSSGKTRAEYQSDIRHLLWGERFWTGSYCVISAGDGANTEITERYISNQKRPVNRPCRFHPYAKSIGNFAAFS